VKNCILQFDATETICHPFCCYPSMSIDFFAIHMFSGGCVRLCRVSFASIRLAGHCADGTLCVSYSHCDWRPVTLFFSVPASALPELRSTATISSASTNERSDTHNTQWRGRAAWQTAAQPHTRTTGRRRCRPADWPTAQCPVTARRVGPVAVRQRRVLVLCWCCDVLCCPMTSLRPC